MDAQTLEALEGSIKKWEAIVDDTRTDKGAQDCPLCRIFHRGGCLGCPVYELTGIINCGDSPYTKVDDARIEFGFGSVEYKKAANNELEFLRSLHPNKAKDPTP